MAVRTAQEKSAINRMLGTHGLPPLESGQGLMVALAFLVQDHEHLRSLLIRCEPENRSDMYNSLKPNLRFEARPLDAYIAESALKAERDNLPLMEPDGNLKWPNPEPVNVAQSQEFAGALFGDMNAAQKAVNEAFAKHRLAMACRSCTKEALFTGDTKTDAVMNARLEGWVYYEHEGVAQEICPECPAIRKVS